MRVYSEISGDTQLVRLKAGLTRKPDTCFIQVHCYITLHNWPLAILIGVLPKVGFIEFASRNY